MVQCTTCGNSFSGGAGSCPKCGSTITLAAAAAAAGAATSVETLVVKSAAPDGSRNVPANQAGVASTSTPDEGRFLAGTLIAGRYRIIGLLGRGGMGEVYRATDLTLGQSVALKFLPESAAITERLLERFHTEVRIARQVSHPNICRVYDIGQADGLPFMSMEYVDGEDLSSLLQRIGHLPVDKALEIARKLCAGLAAAHERGIIHRDLKPHNIMLNRRGEVLIMDFGLAAVADELRGSEARNGTPAYMSPEQLRGDSVTAKSDIYALGLIIYELLTGNRAFTANSVGELLHAQETSRPPSVSSVVTDADPVIERVILRCLRIDPAERPPSALAVAAALPGGDPLAAALAAGETPSPELVAASGKAEGFRLRYAISCLAFVLIGLISYPFLMQSLSVPALAPLDLPPEVLEAKARDTAALLGYPAKPADSVAWFGVAKDMLDYYAKQKGTKDWRKLFAAESPMQFYYRQSPLYLLSPPDGRITTDRPPLNVEGMVSAMVDSRGRLRQFEAVAPRFAASDQAAAPVDPAVVFRSAGLDIARFTEAPPTYAPSLAFDARRAWSGPHPELPDTNIKVELATWRGKPTSFKIVWPWTKPPQTMEKPWMASSVASNLFSALFMGTGLFCGIFFARRNLRLNRGDRQGAFRLATVAFSFIAFSVLMRVHYVPDMSVIGYIFEDLSNGLMLCGILWLLYIALEPSVRARWPHSLVTWNRLLAGQIGDARLGSHILLGAVLGVALIYLIIWRGYLIQARGGAPDTPNLEALIGLRRLLRGGAETIFGAMLSGAVIFFVLSGLRALVRRDWIAALVAAVLFAIQEPMLTHSSNLVLDASLVITLFTAFAFVLLRMGLVPAIAGMFVMNMVFRIVIPSDFSAWTTPSAVSLTSLVALIALYGFWRSQMPTPARLTGPAAWGGDARPRSRGASAS